MSGQQQTTATPSEIKNRAARLQHAFEYWARNFPANFSEVAPILLLDAVKTDPVELDKLESWLSNELPREDFQIELKTPKDFEPVPFNYSRYGPMNKAWLDTLYDRFFVQEGLNESRSDHNRWGRAVRDQFMILGMIASEPEGVNQGRIVKYLQIPVNEEASRRYAANMVRAAKIALTRLAKKAARNAGLDDGDVEIFKQAKKHGVNRVYAFKDERFRILTYKWVMSLPAGKLIPPPLTEN